MRRHLQAAGQWVRTAPNTGASLVMSAALHGLAGMPYRTRRRGVGMILTILKPLITGRDNDRVSRVLAKTLSLSVRGGRQFVYRKLRHDMMFLVEWAALGRRSVAGLIADTRHLTTDNDEELQWLAAQRGAIIGTMHFGPYSLAIVWLIHTYFQGRKVIIFKSDNDTGVEQRAVARLAELGADVEFIAPEAVADFHRLIKDVRRGAVVIIMVDLPPAFGRSDVLDVLGHRIAFASGAVDLAALSRAPLMLLRTRASAHGDRLEVSDIFDVVNHDSASRERGAARIARFVGDTLYHYPDQWHMWERFAEYLPTRREAVS